MHSPQSSLPTEFLGKQWIDVVKAIFFGGLGVAALVMGPLCYLGLWKKVDGKAATEAGLGLTLASVFFLILFALAVSNISAKRTPLLRICREGIVIRMIGASSLDKTPFIPAFARLVWLVLSFEGFRDRTLYVPWNTFQEVKVTGPMMARLLTIVGPTFLSSEIDTSWEPPFANETVLPEVTFVKPLQQIADAVRQLHQSPQIRDTLPSWRIEESNYF